MGMHLISNPFALGHLNTIMSCVSFLLSVGYADANRSAGQIAYIDSRTEKNHAGTDTSRALG